MQRAAHRSVHRYLLPLCPRPEPKGELDIVWRQGRLERLALRGKPRQEPRLSYRCRSIPLWLDGGSAVLGREGTRSR